MKTNYTNTSIPAKYSRDPGTYSLIAAGQETKWAQKSAARRKSQREATKTAKDDADTRAKFTPDTQPRNSDGKFRKILARLKLNLGDDSTGELAKQIESVEAAQVAGNYEEVRESSGELMKMLDSAAEGEIPKGTAKNLRQGSSDLAKVMAYLPLPQGDANAKVRFSDLPPASAELVRSMVKQVKEQLDAETAEKYIAVLEQYMAGARTMGSDEMASNLNKLLRVLA